MTDQTQASESESTTTPTYNVRDWVNYIRGGYFYNGADRRWNDDDGWSAVGR